MTAREIVQALGGRWHGSYGMCLCPAHLDGQTPALKIADADDQSDGVLVHCFAGCDWKIVKAALRERGLLEEWSSAPRARSRTPRPVMRATTDNDDQRRSAYARKLWHKAVPAAGTLAATYLRHRGITIPIPTSIRYLAGAKHKPTGLLMPTMIAAVEDVDGEVTGVHRTFLSQDGTRKAQVLQPKMMFGKCAGGAVRLGPVARKIAVAEGVETSLSVAQACPGLPVWAALSTSGMKALVLPVEVHEVVLMADGDILGNEAARQAAHRFVREGRIARLASAPAGKDFNDVLREAG